MSRTRTQTALTRLVKSVANVNGELEALERLLPQHQDQRHALMRRQATLERQRQALHATIRQFDPKLDPTSIGCLDDWTKAYGRRSSKAALGRYLVECARANSPKEEGRHEGGLP